MEKKSSFRRRFLGGVVALLGTLISFFLFAEVRDWERERHHLILDRRAEVLATVLRREIDSQLGELSSIGAFFDGATSIDRRQFRGFVSRILDRHPGIQGLEWIPRVRARDVDAYVAEAARHAVALRLTERDSAGRLVDAAPREEYFPVFYVEPVAGNERALGFDLASNEARRRALRQARDQAAMVATAPIRLVQDASVPGQLVLFPVYRTGAAPAAVSERRRQLVGYALAVYRIPAMIESALAGLETGGLDIRVVDRTGGGEETLFHRGHQGKGPGVLVHTTALETAGRRWALEFFDHPAAAATGGWQAPATLGAGVVLTLLLVSFLLSLLGRTEEVERLVAVRTRELEHTTELLEDARDDALVASRLKSQFLANMSHELRTPLSSIIGGSELLVDGVPGPVNAEQLRYGTDILESGRHLLGLIDDVLDLSELEAGTTCLESEQSKLPGLVDDVMTQVKAQAEAKGIELRTDFDSSLQPLWVDPARFRQVLLNLLSNALKFTPGGGRVTVGARFSGGSVELSVNDTGPGIKPEHRELIFEDFRQVEEGDAREYQGTGLGLALCRRFLDLMQGDIRVESELGRGSAFIVTLPSGPVQE